MRRPAPSPRRFAWLQGPALALVTLALLVGCLELAAWAVDRGSTRDRLRAALLQESRSLDPISDQIPCPWTGDDVIYVRASDKKHGPDPHQFMGRVIVEQATVARQAPLRPRGIPSGKRPVFVVGGSAAFGYPYHNQQSLAVQLQNRLGASYRVINAAQPGWTSGQLTEVVRRAARFRPHAVVLFLGNNEWFHWALRPLNASQRRALAAWRLASHSHQLSLAAVTLCKRFWFPHGLHLPPAAPQTRGLSREESAGQWPSVKVRFLKNLERSLGVMIRQGKSAGARVVLLTVPFNYRLHPSHRIHQPFSLVAARAPRLRRLTEEVDRLQREGKLEQALAAADRALALDHRAPLLHHLRALALVKQGRLAEAERAFARAREHTIGNLGSVLSINKALRRAARKHGASLVDVKKLFDEHQHALGRYFNQDLIHDDCHSTPAGNGIMARAVAAALRR